MATNGEKSRILQGIFFRKGDEHVTDKTKKRKIRINRPQDIRRLLAAMINEVKNSDDIPTEKKAQLIATLSNSTLRAIEQGDLLERMEKYEKELQQYKELLERSGRLKGR